jgi:hypothetical protein
LEKKANTILTETNQKIANQSGNVQSGINNQVRPNVVEETVPIPIQPAMQQPIQQPAKLEEKYHTIFI